MSIPGRQTLLDGTTTHVKARQNQPAQHAALPSLEILMVFFDVGVGDGAAVGVGVDQ